MLMSDIQFLLKALNNSNRLQILQWLKTPRENFPQQVDGDLVDDGVCGGAIAEKLNISPPALSVHMRLLLDAGLVEGKKMKGWVFYKRDDAAIRLALTALSDGV